MAVIDASSLPRGGGVRSLPQKFLVAFSFAGEQRDLVRPIAEELEQRLGLNSVFFDEWYQHVLGGIDADILLQDIYLTRSILVVPCISEQYGKKPWTQAEFRAIRALLMTLDEPAAGESARNRILPIRVGTGDVRGIVTNTICPDARDKPAAKTAELIFNRLKTIPDAESDAGPFSRQPSLKRVYLAECTPDLEDPTRPISRARTRSFLEERGFTVLPATEYPTERYQELLEKDLRECIAFVQLLGPYAWKRENYDQVQNVRAEALGMKRFRYCSADLAAVGSARRELLSSPDIIHGGFEDFKVYLERELATLSLQREAAARGDKGRDIPPLVLVSIHSRNPDPLWEKVFRWLYEHQKIDLCELRRGESLETKNRAEPCQGFLIVCDATALDEATLSPRPVMEECRAIQLREKDRSRRPPVGLVYWPPPPPDTAWPKLLKTTPLNLHQIRGDELEAASGFFQEVRIVAQ